MTSDRSAAAASFEASAQAPAPAAAPTSRAVARGARPSGALPARGRPSASGVRAPGRAAGQASRREHTLSLALQHVLDAHAPLSRADIASATGLARATVSGLVDQLIAARLVVELEPLVSQRA